MNEALNTCFKWQDDKGGMHMILLRTIFLVGVMAAIAYLIFIRRHGE